MLNSIRKNCKNTDTHLLNDLISHFFIFKKKKNFCERLKIESGFENFSVNVRVFSQRKSHNFMENNKEITKFISQAAEFYYRHHKTRSYIF